MQLGKALALAAKVASAKKGGGGKIWLVGHGELRCAIARKEGATVVVRAPKAPDGVIAFDAPEASTVRTALERLDEEHVEIYSRPPDGVRVTDGLNHADLSISDPRDAPMVPSLDRVSWGPLDAESFATIRRVAASAAKDRDDRKGLTYFRLAVGGVEATDESVVARAPLANIGRVDLKVPAHVASLLPTKKSAVGYLGTLGGGSAVIAVASGLDHPVVESEVLIFTDGTEATSHWFPDLRAVWAAADQNPAQFVRVGRAEIKAAAKAAAAGSESTVVAVSAGPDGVLFGGGSTQAVARGASRILGPVYVNAQLLARVLAHGEKELFFGFRSAAAPLEVVDGTYRALIYPVLAETITTPVAP